MDNLIIQKKIYDELFNYVETIKTFITDIDISNLKRDNRTGGHTENSVMGFRIFGANYKGDDSEFTDDIFNQQNITYGITSRNETINITRKSTDHLRSDFNSISLCGQNRSRYLIAFDVYIYSSALGSYTRIYNKFLNEQMPYYSGVGGTSYYNTVLNDTETIDIPVTADWDDTHSRFGYIQVTCSGSAVFDIKYSIKHYSYKWQNTGSLGAVADFDYSRKDIK